MKILLYLILLIFPFGQFFRIDLTNFFSGLVFQPIDLAIFLFNFVWGVDLLKITIKTKKQISPLLFGKEILIFLVICIFSLLVNIPKYGFNLSSFFYLLRAINLFVFLWAFCSFIKKNQINILKILFLEGVVISLFSVIQYLFVPDTRFLFDLGWDRHYFRAIGPFLDPSFNGLLCVFSFFVFIRLFLQKEKVLKEKFLLVLGGIVIFVSIALSFSRLDYLILLVGLFIMLFNRKMMKYLISLCFVFAVVVLFLPKPTGEGVDLLRKSSFFARSDNYRYSVQTVKDNFLTGVGFNNYRYAQKQYGFLNISDWQTSHTGGGADNSFLLVFATTGVFGFIAFIYLWFKILKRTLTLKNKEKLIVLPMLIGLLFSSFFVNSLFYPWILVWLFLVLGEATVPEK